MESKYIWTDMDIFLALLRTMLLVFECREEFTEINEYCRESLQYGLNRQKEAVTVIIKRAY